MRILEERKDYTLYYDTYEVWDEQSITFSFNSPIKETKTNAYMVVEVFLSTPYCFVSRTKKLKNLDKDLKQLSKKLIKRWKKEK